MSPDTGLAVNTQQNALSKNEDQKERKKKTMHKIGASLYPPPLPIVTVLCYMLHPLLFCIIILQGDLLLFINIIFIYFVSDSSYHSFQI